VVGEEAISNDALLFPNQQKSKSVGKEGPLALVRNKRPSSAKNWQAESRSRDDGNTT
jgi:hypothetical protein